MTALTSEGGPDAGKVSSDENVLLYYHLMVWVKKIKNPISKPNIMNHKKQGMNPYSILFKIIKISCCSL